MRLSVLSNEQLDPWVNWSTLGPPLLQPLARFAQGTVLAPPPLRLGHAERWWRALRGASGADTYFWMQGSSRPEWPLVLLSAFGGRVRRSAYVIDAWKPQLNKIGLAAIV
jgi:hypothetical protein